MTGHDALTRALACIAPERLAKAAAARQRYRRRQARLARLAAEQALQRQALLQDVLARSRAKAGAAPGDDSGG